MLLGTVKLHRSIARERRLNANSFLSEDQELLDALESWPGKKKAVSEIASTFRGPIFKRNYVDNPEFGYPYVSAADIDRSDYFGSRLISRGQGVVLDRLRLTSEMIIVTCSGMNLGWSMLSRRDLSGVIGSHDLIRVIAASPEDRGFLGAFLGSKLGWFSVRQSISGGSVKHIEPPDVDRLQIPWPAKSIRTRISDAYLRAAELRAESTLLIQRATDSVFDSSGIEDIDEGAWFGEGRELGFIGHAHTRSLRAWNCSEKASRLLTKVKTAGAVPLAQWVKDNSLKKCASFKRIPAEPEYGVPLIGQRQLLRFRPRPKYLAKNGIPQAAMCDPGTTLIASCGTFGEAEVFGRAQFASSLTSNWLFSNHILRVVPANSVDAGWLFAFLRSRTAFRLLRSLATGSKQQDIHPQGVAELPVLKGTKSTISKVNDLVHKAFELRDEAYHLESTALDGIIAMVREGA